MAQATRQVQVSTERLATGQKLNRASDGPAAVIAVENFKVRENEIKARLDNIGHESTYLGAREGAMSVVGDLLTELDGLIVQAANRDALAPEELDALQIEIDAKLDALGHLSDTTMFKGQRLLQGFGVGMGHASRTFRNEQDELVTSTFSIADLRSGGTLDVRKGDLGAAQEVARSAKDSALTTMGAIGNRLKSLENEKNGLLTELENVAGARSMLADTDYARETAALVRARALEQAGIFVTKIAQEHTASVAAALIASVVK